MAFRAIVDDLRALPQDAPMEEEARACLANLLIGLRQSHIASASARKRLSEMVAGVERSSKRDFRILLLEHDAAMSAFGIEDHYDRPGPLDDYLDMKGLTIQANEDGILGRFWLEPPRRAGGAEIEDAFKRGECVGHVGRVDRPIWLTPMTGEAATIIENAANSFCTAVERASYARRIVALLGLSHIQPTTEILAMVTRETIGELLYERPSDGIRQGPAGSTAIEARGHRRFRAWPRDGADPFGRTFDMNDAKRDAIGKAHGAPEVVRPRLEMAGIERCIFLGPLTAKDVDRKGAYLEDLDVHRTTTPDLLLTLASLAGL